MARREQVAAVAGVWHQRFVSTRQLLASATFLRFPFFLCQRIQRFSPQFQSFVFFHHGYLSSFSASVIENGDLLHRTFISQAKVVVDCLFGTSLSCRTAFWLSFLYLLQLLESNRFKETHTPRKHYASQVCPLSLTVCTLLLSMTIPRVVPLCLSEHTTILTLHVGNPAYSTSYCCASRLLRPPVRRSSLAHWIARLAASFNCPLAARLAPNFRLPINNCLAAGITSVLATPCYWLGCLYSGCLSSCRNGAFSGLAVWPVQSRLEGLFSLLCWLGCLFHDGSGYGAGRFCVCKIPTFDIVLHQV